MVIVSIENCRDCLKVIESFCGYEVVELRRAGKSQSEREMQVKKALHAAEHDGQFPCAFDDPENLTGLIPRDDLLKLAEDYVPNFTFRRPNTVPPGSKYFFTVPKTRTRLESGTMDGCMMQVRKHLRANQLPVPADLRAVIADHMCQKLPANFCRQMKILKRIPPTRRVQNPTLSAQSISSESMRLMEQRKQDKPYVIQYDAEMRASVCLGCPKHMNKICTTCNGLAAVKDQWLPTRKTSKDKALEVCGVTGMLAAAMVHFKTEIVKSISRGKSFPENCWIWRTSDESGSGTSEREQNGESTLTENQEPDSGALDRSEDDRLRQDPGLPAGADSGDDRREPAVRQEQAQAPGPELAHER